MRDGDVPLLGPPTSIGDFHHGAVYYYLLAPAAALTGGDPPLAVVLEIALFGIAAVAVTWWLARSIGGPVAGLVAGLVMAVSASAIEESTFIWNPNLIALTSAVALAARVAGLDDPPRSLVGRWRRSGPPRPCSATCWASTLLPVVGALLVADARRRGPAARRVGPCCCAGLGRPRDRRRSSYVPLASTS